MRVLNGQSIPFLALVKPENFAVEVVNNKENLYKFTSNLKKTHVSKKYLKIKIYKACVKMIIWKVIFWNR